MKAKNVSEPGALIDRGNTVANWPSGTDVVTVSSTSGDFLHPNAFTYNVTRSRRLNGDIKGKNGYWGANPPYVGVRSVDANGPVQPDVYVHTFQDIAYNKALSRLNDKVRGGLDLSVALAESGKTAAMIKSLARFSRWFSGIGPKRWANEWLQLQYGWKPLLGDIYGIADESLNVVRASSYFRASATDKPTLVSSRDLSNVDWSGTSYFLSTTPSIFYCKSKITGELIQLCKIGVNLKQPTSTTQLARWTSLNPLSIAWELTPYSFVVDWFYDIGGYLRDYETSLLYNSVFDFGYVSRLSFQRVSEEAYCNYMNVPNYFNSIDYVKVRGWHRRASFSRTILTSYPVPMKPVLTADLSSNRLLSTAALLAQKLRR